MFSTSRRIVFFFFFSVLTLVLYLGTVHAKFVFDFINLSFEFQQKGWGDLGNFQQGLSPNFVAKFFFYSLLTLFHFQAWLWYVATCLLHACNGFLFYLLWLKAGNKFNLPYAASTAFCISLLFLVSPYHTETIVWGGALNYLIVSFFILLHLNVLWQVANGSKWKLFWAVFTFVAALFSHEWGLVLIPLDALFFIAYWRYSSSPISPKLNGLIAFLLLAVGFYLANQMLLGQPIGHYGAQVHFHFALAEMIPALYKYLLKILFFAGFWSVPFQNAVYAFLQHTWMVYSLTLVLCLALLAAGYALFNKPQRYALTSICFFSFLFFVTPVLNLYFPYWIRIHADRYCYLPQAFLIAAVILLIPHSKLWLQRIVCLVYLIFSLWFLHADTLSWKIAGKMQTALEQQFHWWNAPHVYLLNVPDNFRGAYMFRNKQPSAFEGNFIKYGSVPHTPITEVLNYNLNQWSDSVHVEIIDSNQLKVALTGPDTWWWRNTYGATDYETDEVKVDVDDSNWSYVVTFKQKQPGDIFLYQANGQWHPVKNF